jgi:DNA-binding transcriptional LysR family regulator
MVLDASSAVVGRIDALAEQLAELKRSVHTTVRVTYALDDRTSIDALSLAFSDVKASMPGTSIRPERVREASTLEALAKDSVDLAVLYDLSCVDPNEFCSVPFKDDHVLIALARTSETQGRTTVRPEEVAGYSVPWPSGSRDNYVDCGMHLFDGCSRHPSIRWIDADNMDAFFMHAIEPQEMWFLSKNHHDLYAGSIPASYLDSIVTCTLEGVDSSFTRYAVWRKDCENPAVKPLADALYRRYLDEKNAQPAA